MRAVLDPNVLISALLSPSGAPAELILAWSGGEFELVVCPLLLDELRRALAYAKLRRRVPRADAEEFVAWLERAAELAPDPADPPPVSSPDAGDDYLIALAAQERALLVSGDRHLLRLEEQLPILRARDFLARLRDR